MIVLLMNITFNEKLPLITTRIIASFVIILLSYLSTFTKSKVIVYFRFLFLCFMLSVWYPETFDFNRYLANKDYLIVGLEQSIFGMQPALFFHDLFPQNWFSEIMNFGYIAYYPIIILTGLYFLKKNRSDFKYYFFMLLFSFYIYYLIYILFPTAGPQYYFCAIGPEDSYNAVFPKLFDYFNLNPELNCHQNNRGFFLYLVEKTQLAGERPTAAFPSSHVGITTLIVLILKEKRKYLILRLLLPIYVALVAATVYIQAHYVVDVFAGLLSSALLYISGKYIFNKIQSKNTEVEERIE